MVDYVRDTIPHDHFGGSSTTWVVWANFVTSSFFSFSLVFFSARPGRISCPIGTTYTPKRVLSATNVPFGVSTISDYIQGSNP